MHSNAYLVISLAAMTHVGAAIPNLAHSCDTHHPWNSADDVIVPGATGVRDCAVKVPTDRPRPRPRRRARPRAHRRYLDSGTRDRDDTGYMRRIRPERERRLPRW
ncbi:hypothetical protein RB628_08060 [Streptomyces sp. ADMS]|nr:hypothetical protein [Streptomyces sp. ADMS]MDW4905303.1 hypothetical protein [Streptomyces sp. ADMS]